MPLQELNAVTGAFGFSGRSITRRLLASGKQVLTLTSKIPDTEFEGRVQVAPFDFDHPERLVESLRGASVLYNTYWIRFAHGSLTFDKAVANSRALVSAAKAAGVKRIVHVSIANPSLESPLPYYNGKALVEQAIRESGMSYAILRPAVLFGDKGILVNNIAWFLRHLPVFAAPGDGNYGMQPIFVDDLADLAVEYGAREENATIDAVGPEKFTFDEWLALIGEAVNRRTLVMHLPPDLVRLATGMMSRVLGDVILTGDEVKGLMANLLVSEQEPNAPTKLTEWMHANSSWLGTRYMSEVKAHYR